MRRVARSLLLFTVTALAVCLLTPAARYAVGQPKPAPPAIPKNYPTVTTPATFGAKRGGSVEATLTGSELASATGVWLSFPGKATLVEQKDPKAAPKVKVEVPADSPVGLHSFRFATAVGISNPRPFVVDELPEVEKKAGNNKRETAQVVPVPSVVVGAAAAETADFYKFPVKAGESITVEAVGRRLGSQIDPVIILYDGTGRELPGLYADDTPGLQSDARVSHTFPSAGDIIVEVRDTTYRGGADFGYRLRIGNFPGATCAFPLAVQRGKKTEVGFAGPGLDGVKPVSVTATAGDVAYVAPKKDALSGWPVAVRVHDHPELVEQEPNNELAKANPIPVPGGISAKFEGKNDIDFFKFPGKKGAKLVIQALTYELALNTEVYLKVLDSKGAELAKSNPQQAGVRVEFTPPADGDFFVSCEHTNYVSGPNEVYHLSVRPAAPDFAVAVGLDRIDAPVGGLGLIPITGVTRANGFAGPIDVSFEGADGVTGKLTIPAGANPQPPTPLFLPLKVKAGTKPGPVVGVVKATAKIDGKDEVRISSLFDITKAAYAGMPNPPAEVAQQVAVAVTPEPPFALTLTFDTPTVPKGGTLKGKLAAKRADKFTEEIAVAAVGVPVSAVPKLKNIGKDGKDVEVELSVPVSVPLGPGEVILKGTAKVAGKDVGVLVTATINVTEAKKEEPKKDEPKKEPKKDEPKKK